MCTYVFLIWAILEAREKSVKNSGHFLGNRVWRKIAFEIYWPLVVLVPVLVFRTVVLVLRQTSQHNLSLNDFSSLLFHQVDHSPKCIVHCAIWFFSCRRKAIQLEESYWTRTTDNLWRQKSKISEKLGRNGRQYASAVPKIWEWEWVLGPAAKAISSLGVRSPQHWISLRK